MFKFFLALGSSFRRARQGRNRLCDSFDNLVYHFGIDHLLPAGIGPVLMLDTDPRMELGHVATAPNVSFLHQDLFAPSAAHTLAAAAANASITVDIKVTVLNEPKVVAVPAPQFYGVLREILRTFVTLRRQGTTRTYP